MKNLKLWASRSYAEFLLLVYNGDYIRYSHINRNGFWEFSIWHNGVSVYKTSGLKR